MKPDLPRFDTVAISMHDSAVCECQLVDVNPTGAHERVGTDLERFGAALERPHRWRDLTQALLKFLGHGLRSGTPLTIFLALSCLRRNRHRELARTIRLRAMRPDYRPRYF
jgi:hypothetical protein